MPTHVGILKFITSTYFMLVRVEPEKRFISTESGKFHYQLIKHPSEEGFFFFKKNIPISDLEVVFFSCST